MSVNRIIPSAPIAADGTQAVLPSRTGMYGEAATYGFGADNAAFADEGSGYVVMNATTGTGLTGNAAPIGATSLLPFLHVFNNGSLTIIPRFAWVRVATAPSAGATTTEFLCWSDQGSGASTWTSGGTAITQVNTNGGVSGIGGGIWHAGALVITGVLPRKLWHVQARSVISVVQDSYFITFGGTVPGLPAGVATSGTTIMAGHIAMPAMACPSKTNWSLSIDGLAQSGAGAYEFSLFYTER
jgi:hypothetical protein